MKKNLKIFTTLFLALLISISGVFSFSSNAEWRKTNYYGWIWYENGKRANPGWYHIGNKWYYFTYNIFGLNSNYELYYNNKSYYIGAYGEMRTGWIRPDPSVGFVGSWIYANRDGSIRKNGWLHYKNDWYFLEGDGSMTESTIITYNNKMYYFTSNGKMMHSGWFKDPRFGLWMYAYKDGHIATNTEIDGWVIGASGVAFPKNNPNYYG